MNYATIRNAIEAAVRAALGWTYDENDSDTLEHMYRVAWADSEVSTYNRPMPYLDMSWFSEASIGVDENRKAIRTIPAEDPDDAPTFELDRTIEGNRTITVTIRAFSFSVCSGDGAQMVTGRLRTRLRRAGVLEILHAANLAIATIGTANGLPFEQDDRELSASVFDVVFSIAENDDPDDSPTSRDWFNRVETENNVTT